MTCIQCGQMIPGRLSSCPNCGRPAESVPGGLPAKRPAVRRRQPLRLDARRWTQNDRVVAGASAVLLISLFLPWFGINFLGTTVVAVDGLASHRYLYAVLALCVLLMFYLVLRLSSFPPLARRPEAHDRLMLAATSVNFAVTLAGFIFTPGSSFVGPLLSREYGAFIGVIAALVALLPVAASVFNFSS